MKLLELKCEGCGGVPDGTYRFADRAGAPLSTIILTGPAASGKTRLLEAIVAAKEDVGGYLPSSLRPRVLREGRKSAAIEATWWLHGEERETPGGSAGVTTLSRFGDGAPLTPRHPAWLRRLFEGKDRKAGQGSFEFFHAMRDLGSLQSSRSRGWNEAHDRRLWLANDNEKYAVLGAWLAETVSEEERRLARAAAEEGVVFAGNAGLESALRDRLAPFLVDKSFVGFGARGDEREPLFLTRTGDKLPLAALSASERQGVLLVLTFARRALDQSIVLLDEPELHIHPERHRQLLDAVIGLARDAQFFIATSSPRIVEGAAREELVSLAQKGS